MIERERKFLLNYLPDLGEYFKKPQKLKQGYLLVKKKKQFRIRITNDHYCHICYKQNINKQDRYEFEYLIPKDEGFKLYDLAQFKLEKNRFITVYNNHKVDIDIYPSGLGIVEIEFDDHLDSLPDYCGEEVTGKKEYSNLFLAKKNNEFF